MRVHRLQQRPEQDISFELLDDDDCPIPVVSGFMRHLRARGCSPNTLSGYCFDLLHFMTFLRERRLTYQEFRPSHALLFLEYLSTRPIQKQAQRLTPVLSTTTDEGYSTTRLSPATINRILAAVSSFYEYLILSEQFSTCENPIQQGDDPAYARVADRHRPFMGLASRQRPMRRVVHVKTIQRVPRPLDDDQLNMLLGSLRLKRDRAMILLMLHGGLRPGEVLRKCQLPMISGLGAVCR